ncbi:unnamed protein product, partial [Polarella glacialis]
VAMQLPDDPVPLQQDCEVDTVMEDDALTPSLAAQFGGVEDRELAAAIEASFAQPNAASTAVHGSL